MTNSDKKYFKTISFSRLYPMSKLLTTFITFFTSDDSRLYQIAILQVSMSPYHKR